MLTCERCGKEIETIHDAFYIQLIHRGLKLDISRLCEQCYQTIKEVLEDGQIK